MTKYKGYNVDAQMPGIVTVRDPRFGHHGIYHAKNTADAKQWIDDYRDGRQWAVDAYVTVTPK